MRQRSLGILGGALLIGGIALGIGAGITAGSLANPPSSAALVPMPGSGGVARHRASGAPGPFAGIPGRRGFPGAGGGRVPSPTSPSPSPTI